MQRFPLPARTKKWRTAQNGIVNEFLEAPRLWILYLDFL